MSSVTVVDRSQSLEGVSPEPAHVLFPEARQRRRRRIVAGIVTVGFLLVATAITVSGVTGVLGGGSRTQPPGSPVSPVTGSTGMVSGVLKLEAGVSLSGFHGLPGKVSLVSSHGVAHSVNVGSDGTFLMRVSSGTYTAIGQSPNYVSDDTKWPCRSRSPVVVQAGVTSTITVVCEGM